MNGFTRPDHSQQAGRVSIDEIEQARRIPIEDVVAARGWVPKGGWKSKTTTELIGPCLRCGGDDRFGINTKKQVWHCRSCTDSSKPSGKAGGGVIDLVIHLDGCAFAEAVRTLNGGSHPRAIVPDPKAASAPEPADRRWRTVWEEALPLRDPKAALGLSYLTRPRAKGGRGLVIPADLLDGRVLRFHALHWWHMGGERAAQAPALLGLYTDIKTDVPQAIWRRRLTPDGCSAGPPKAMGEKAGCAIKLTPDEDVTNGLAVGEGPETMLGAMMLGYRPAWALGDRGNLAYFPLLPAIDALIICIDHDENGDGQIAAARCYDRYFAAGREVRCEMPREPGADMADVAGAP